MVLPETFKCNICLEFYNEEERCPKNLNCGHTICRSCILQLIQGARSNNEVKCPTCRTATPVQNDVDSIPKNFTVLEIMKSYEPAAKKLKTAGPEQMPFCWKHLPNRVEFLCKDCGPDNRELCKFCWVQEHDGHRVRRLDEEIKHLKEQMEVINKTIELKLRVINAMQQDRNNQLLSHHLNSADVLKRKQALLEFFEKAKVEALKSFENFINVESTKISEDIYAINHDRWVHESAKDQLSLAASTSGLQFIENTISKTQAIAEADLAIDYVFQPKPFQLAYSSEM